jgi:hypothetical protein
LPNEFAHNKKPINFIIAVISDVCKQEIVPNIASVVKYPKAILQSVDGKASALDMTDPSIKSDRIRIHRQRSTS